MIEFGTRGRLYFVAVLLFILVLVATAIETRSGFISVYDACWQIIVSMLGGLWFWNLLRIETLRAARRRR